MDYNRLPKSHQELFRDAVQSINAAARTGSGWPPNWPAALRMRQMSNQGGVWEMTWSFAGPDGRATFEFVEIDGEMGIEWRRIGNHEIYRDP